METAPKTLAIIPARGGSQGLPGKNIRPLHGHPLIAWTIAQALACPAIDRVMVSTDSPDIQSVARAYGAEVPFLRPPDIAGPKSLVEETLLHAVAWYEQEGFLPDRIVLLQPTSPIRFVDTLTKAFEKFDAGQCDSLVSVYAHSHFYWKNTVPPTPLYNHIVRPMRQDLREEDHIIGEIGLFIITDVAALRRDHSRVAGKPDIFMADRWESFEIDTLEDFQFIELLMQACKERLPEPKRVH